jgi:hypothetical protein
MTIYDKTSARNVARDLISTALQSGAIKLIGASNPGVAQATSDADATYLSNLLIKLAEKLSTGKD